MAPPNSVNSITAVFVLNFSIETNEHVETGNSVECRRTIPKKTPRIDLSLPNTHFSVDLRMTLLALNCGSLYSIYSIRVKYANKIELQLEHNNDYYT